MFAAHVQCEDDAAWATDVYDGMSEREIGCDALTSTVNQRACIPNTLCSQEYGYQYQSCDSLRDSHDVTATQACSVACSGGDVTSCQEFDNCWDSPCLNGGVCTDGLGTFTCACPAHYGGPACETYSGPNQDIVRVSVHVLSCAAVL